MVSIGLKLNRGGWSLLRSICRPGLARRAEVVGRQDQLARAVSERRWRIFRRDGSSRRRVVGRFGLLVQPLPSVVKGGAAYSRVATAANTQRKAKKNVARSSGLVVLIGFEEKRKSAPGDAIRVAPPGRPAALPHRRSSYIERRGPTSQTTGATPAIGKRGLREPLLESRAELPLRMLGGSSIGMTCSSEKRPEAGAWGVSWCSSG